LRILTLWFNHGSLPDVEAALQEGFQSVSIDTWLVVIPQVGHADRQTDRQAGHYPEVGRLFWGSKPKPQGFFLCSRMLKKSVLF
jgi:hypothetical protein